MIWGQETRSVLQTNSPAEAGEEEANKKREAKKRGGFRGGSDRDEVNRGRPHVEQVVFRNGRRINLL